MSDSVQRVSRRVLGGLVLLCVQGKSCESSVCHRLCGQPPSPPIARIRPTRLMGDGERRVAGGTGARMDRHEQTWQRAKGFLAAVSVLFAVIEVAVEAWHRH